jgi:glycosyltransferase involved in cell wall biosynthesis
VLRWAAPYAIWLWYARRAAVQAARDLRPDAILTSGPPHWIHLLGMSLRNQFQIPWVADFRDPWIVNDPMPRVQMRQRWELFWERRVLKRTDVIVANAPRARAMFQKAYPHVADRVVSVPNGYDPEMFTPLSDHRPGSVLHILHAGQLYAGRDPGPLLDALRDLPPNTPAFRVDFLGRTKYRDGLDLDEEVRRRHLEATVRGIGQLGYHESIQAMCEADILLLLDSAGRKIGVPAKVYEYLGAGRPILALGEPDGDLAAVLADSGVPHRIASPNDSAAIRSALLDLVTAVAENRLPTGDPQKRLQFTREALAGRLADVLNNCCRNETKGADAEPELAVSGRASS